MRFRLSLAIFGLLLSLPANGQETDIFNDGETLRSTIGNLAGCDLSRRLRAEMQIEPLYTNASGSCAAKVPSESGQYFTDSSCENSIEFSRTGQWQFCTEALDKQSLGNGAAVVNSAWTLPPGARYDIGVKSLAGLKLPYRTRVNYRTINTDRGECNLEMRVYKNNIAAKNLTPLIAFHGGSWKSRGFGTFGIESMVAHYTNKGFVVFAPYYRLLSESEPNVECQSAAIDQITEDAEAALTWVNRNASRYGAKGKPVVMGQSAGAHLSLALAVNKSELISAALLMYPPTDFADFISLVVAQEYDNEEGLGVLREVLGGEADAADVSLSPVPENSFPARVAQNPGRFPPMVIFHGLADELVPARQSMRLCNALAGRALDDIEFDDVLQQTLQCGERSQLHLFKQANHALDICLSNNVLLSAICPAGGQDSRQLVATLFDESTDYLYSVATTTTSGSSGGGGAMWMFLFYLPGLIISRRRPSAFVSGGGGTPAKTR